MDEPVKEEEIRQRAALDRYLELVSEDVRTMFSDRSCFIQIDCPACGNKNYRPQFEKSGFTYVLCPECGTLFVNPRPPAQLLTDYYTSSRSASFWVHDFFQPVAEARIEGVLPILVDGDGFIRRVGKIEDDLQGFQQHENQRQQDDIVDDTHDTSPK